MKKDDILILRLVSVAVLLAALALIILLGVRFNIYAKISSNITDGLVTNSQGRYPLYSEQYYKGFDVLYQILYALLVYTSILSVAGIFFRIKGTPAIAKTAGVTGIVTGTFLILSKIFEKSEFFNELFSRIYLGQSVNYNKVLDGVSAIPVRAVIFGVILILVGTAALVMIKKSHMGSLKIYNSAGSVTGLVILLPVIYGTVYTDIIRSRLLYWTFTHTTLSDTVYGILDTYYLKDIFFLSLDKIIVIMVAALATVALHRLGVKKKMIRHIIVIPALVLSVAGFIVFMANPKRLFGYVSLDEGICDRVETTGTIAALLMATDMVLIALLTAQCLDLSAKISQAKVLTAVLCLIIASVLAVFAGFLVTEISVYVSLLVINVLAILALMFFMGVGKSRI